MAVIPRITRICGHSFVAEWLPREPAIVDLGMNHGAFSAGILGLRPQARIVGCEPVPSLFDEVRSSFGAGVLNVAIGPRAGEGSISVFRRHCASTVLREVEPESEVLRVDMVTLDDLVQVQSLRRADLLKVDIEGAELDMLQGASRILANCDQVSVEFHDFLDPSTIPAIRRCIAALRSRGFVAFRCSLLNRSDVLFVHRRMLPSRTAVALVWIAVVRSYLTAAKLGSFLRYVRRTTLKLKTAA